MLIIGYLIGLVLVVAALLGLYVLTKPTDALIEKWQRVSLRLTHKPLKDEDFLYLPKIIPVMRVLGVAIIGLSGWGLYSLVDMV
jgi:hypothetical protein